MVGIKGELKVMVLRTIRVISRRAIRSDRATRLERSQSYCCCVKGSPVHVVESATAWADPESEQRELAGGRGFWPPTLRLELHLGHDQLFHLFNSERAAADVEATNHRVFAHQLRPKTRASLASKLAGIFVCHFITTSSIAKTENEGRKQVRPI